MEDGSGMGYMDLCTQFWHKNMQKKSWKRVGKVLGLGFMI